MQLATYRYSPAKGWDQTPDRALDSADSLLVLFGPSAHEPLAAAFADLHAAFPHSHWVGCSTAGQFLGSDIDDDSLVVAVVRFASVGLRSVYAPVDTPADSRQAGRNIATALRAPDLRAVFVLADGLSVNGSELVKGMQAVLPDAVTVTGGLAGDGNRFRETWVLPGQRPAPRHVAAVGFYGRALGIASASKGGWDVVGPERVVTRSEANVLYALDGQPALEIYKRYLGDRADGLPSTGLLFPLAICNEDDGDGETVRTLLAIDEAEGSITFAGDVPEGARVRLMHANFERLIDAAARASEQLDVGGERHGPLLCLAISCVGRRLILGQRAEEETEATLDMLPAGARQIGYYSYGEISPLASGRCDLHNQTMTLTLLWEEADA